jgi:hypothetical protein
MPARNEQIKEVTITDVKVLGKVTILKTQEGKDFTIANSKGLGTPEKGKYVLHYSPVTGEYQGKEQITRWVGGFERVDGVPSSDEGIRSSPTASYEHRGKEGGEVVNSGGVGAVNWDQKDAWSRRQTAAKCATELACQKAAFLTASQFAVLTSQEFDKEMDKFWEEWFSKVYNSITVIPNPDDPEIPF